jgi:hypothetical protein
MRRTERVFFVLLSLLLLTPLAAGAQQGGMTGSQEGPETDFRLEQNYPNPFNPATRIPFELMDDAFMDGRPATVSIRIYNILLQYVDSPTAVNHPMGDRTSILDLEYMSPGRYEAFWDGRDRTGAPVASGVYILEMTVNGRSRTMKMFVNR